MDPFLPPLGEGKHLFLRQSAAGWQGQLAPTSRVRGGHRPPRRARHTFPLRLSTVRGNGMSIRGGAPAGGARLDPPSGPRRLVNTPVAVHLQRRKTQFWTGLPPVRAHTAGARRAEMPALRTGQTR